MATSEDKPLAPLFLRLTHTGLHKNGTPNLSSVPIYDLQIGLEYGTRKQTIYVPVGGYVDLPLAPRALLALSEGSIGKFVRDGVLSVDVIARFRDQLDCGGAGGTGVSLAAAAPNAERTGGVLSLVIEAGPDIDEFIAGERITVSGLGGAFAGLDGTFTIDSVSLGSGLAGADPDLYLITVASPGSDIPSATLAGTTLTLPDGKVSVELHSSGGGSGLGNDVHSYVAGDAIVTNCVSASSFNLLRKDDGTGIKPNSFFWDSATGEPYWKDSAGILRALLGGGGGGGGGRVYQFSHNKQVPNTGTLYLLYGVVASSSAPFSVDTTATLRAASISVDAVDTKNYDLEILVNGAVVETLPLAAGSVEAFASTFTTVVVAGDNVSARLTRTSGSGRSAFRDAVVSLVIDE